MWTQKVFFNSLLISILVHGIIILQAPKFNISVKNKKAEKIEIRYINIPKTEKRIDKRQETDRNQAKAKASAFLKLPSVITAKDIKNTEQLPVMDRPKLFKTGKEMAQSGSLLVKPSFVKPEMSAAKKVITFHQVEKSGNPVYMSYYQFVREKIRRYAYENYTRTEDGEVYLSFIIYNDGLINEIHVVEGKSAASPYLKEIALKSVRDASPFPNFPKELDYEKLSFNVVVSFEVE